LTVFAPEGDTSIICHDQGDAVVIQGSGDLVVQESIDSTQLRLGREGEGTEGTVKNPTWLKKHPPNFLALAESPFTPFRSQQVPNLPIPLVFDVFLQYWTLIAKHLQILQFFARAYLLPGKTKAVPCPNVIQPRERLFSTKFSRSC